MAQQGISLLVSRGSGRYGDLRWAADWMAWGATAKGIVTAGHCGNAATFSGTNLPFQAENFTGSHDEQWHTVPGLTALNRVKTAGIGYATITSWTSHGLQAIGSWVCKTGNTTGFDCGYLDSRGACATWVPNFNCTFHRVHNDTSDLASPGDSGGPVYFAASDAWGIISGETWNIHEGCTCTLIYTAIDYVQNGLLVTVLTQ